VDNANNETAVQFVSSIVQNPHQRNELAIMTRSMIFDKDGKYLRQTDAIQITIKISA
jgi:hypothetical protein